MTTSSQFTDFDRRAMARALELAERGAQTTQPNPRVGCVIARGDQIIAEGWHERAGGPHAEVVALQALAAGVASKGGAGAGNIGASGRRAGNTGAGTDQRGASAGTTGALGPSTGGVSTDGTSTGGTGMGTKSLSLESAAAGATVYVTLEPCTHHGRTPPCVDALINARVGRVVFAIKDPNPEVAGRGAGALTRAGIEVASGLMETEAEELNAGFLMRMRAGRPFVRVKMGMSLDGRIALANGASQWITGEAARNDVQHWRARSSAILTGIGTVLADDPRLNVRLRGVSRQPLRVVLDTNLRTPPSARLFEGDPKPVIFTASADEARIAALTERGAQVERFVAEMSPGAGWVPSETSESEAVGKAGTEVASTAGAMFGSTDPIASGGAQRLRQVLSRLAQLAINDVLVEAGPTLAGAFVRHSMADELLLYIAPKLLGPQARPLFDLPALEDLQQARQFAIIEQLLIGNDLRLRLRPA